jgi:HSP20 family protein
MTIVRWNPLHELSVAQKALERLTGEAWYPLWGDLDFNETLLVLDVTENDAAYAVVAEFPGVDIADIEVKMSGCYLIIDAEIPEKTIEKGECPRVKERRCGRFYRSIYLTQPVDSTKAEANYQDGMLRLTLPKAEEAMATIVPITVNNE